MTPFYYQYAIGGSVFAVGMIFAAKQGYIGLSGSKLRALLILLGIFVFFACLQGYLQSAHMEELPGTPIAAETEETESEMIGQPVDYAIMAAYFVCILAVGTYFGRRQKTMKDFFFGGQRFAWWLIAFSLVATTVGSYSFVKYSRVACKYGLSSSQTYLNDWIWVPLLIFGWLPILYFSRVTSVPEYFERRFGSDVRAWVTGLVLAYLIGYVGVNLFTMGKALHGMLGIPILAAAVLAATVSAIYVTAGGQTSVIMTDLFQGVMLLATGIVILILGANYLGGFENLWLSLPRDHRLAFANFNTDPSFPSVGIFWQDGMANSAMFYLLHQGIIMRLLAAKSVAEGRKAVIAMVMVLMPVAACVVASGGWVGKALIQTGAIAEPADLEKIFFVTAEFLSRPGLFGLLMASLTAALMSTVDTLITAVAAIVVNDIYRPRIKQKLTERHLLKVARYTAIGVTLLGVGLVPLFQKFGSIYEAHGAFTAAVTPPLVVTLLLSVFWRRFTRRAALCTLVGGTGAMIASIIIPELVQPFAHGVPMVEAKEGLLGGMKQFKFMRACFGMVVSSVIAVAVALCTKPEPEKRQRGLVWGTVADAIRHYKGSPGKEGDVRRARAMPRRVDEEDEYRGTGRLPVVRVSRALAENLDAGVDDLLYVSDTRRWLGGLNSAHAVIGSIIDDEPEPVVEMPRNTFGAVVAGSRLEKPVIVERLY